MYRLTSKAPFNRPSAFDVLPPRPAPLSPPETEMESGPATQEQRQEDVNAISSEAAAQQATTESPATHIRRISNLAYTTSSFSRREPRPVQKQTRWLVMVVPPVSLTREPPNLGHTLSSAPAGRFANGILMPLFPTLYSQLTAIAREFNMPSTTGLCIYLQLSESGVSMLTPRISDESWQVLWGHFFAGDDRAPQLPPHGLPISGRIEFDVDLRRAKWFDAWMGHPRRESGGSVSQEPSANPTHWRGDSRTSLFPTELGADESPFPPEDNPPVTAMSSHTVVQRQVPRPLLLERRDAASVRTFSRHTSRAPSISHEHPSPDAPTQAAMVPTEMITTAKALSPMDQEPAEPQTARKVDLQTKVHQWRQNSSVPGAASNALTAAGQPSLDPVNMPSGTDIALDLDDFAWSISSAGPPSESPVSVDWSEPLPSVHLLGRLQGSVCLTPSVATSFGPLDYDWPDSPVSCVSRRPSPDLGMRMMDYVPLTPTTATSWGPDDSPSPMYSEFEFEYRAPSIDIGVRGLGSRPVTPSTATSWGPPDSSLSLPHPPQRVQTPDAGERAFSDLEMQVRPVRASVFPYYSAWETQPWSHVWPYQAHHRQGNAPVVLSAPGSRMQNKALLPEWPDFAALYPSEPTVERAAANKSLPVELPRDVGYPVLDIYPAAYPYNLDEVYPASAKAEGTLVHRQNREVKHGPPLPEWPDFASLYPSDRRVERAAANKSQPVTLLGPVAYPFLEIYRTAYPYSLDQIYPVNIPPMTHAIQEQSLFRPSDLNIFEKKLLPEWPDFTSLYPADPKIERAASNKSLSVKLQRAEGYPYIVPYDTVYPHHLEDIYPPVQSAPPAGAITKLPVSYKSEMRITSQLLPEYPDFAGLYPSDPMEERVAENKSQSVSLPALGYPFLSVYPSVYPWNLGELYGPRHSEVAPNELVHASSGISVQLPVYSGYPTFNLYPAHNGYPNFDIYPPVFPSFREAAIPPSGVTPGYPAIEHSNAVYPHLVIYPQMQLNVSKESTSPKPISPRKRAPTPGPGRRRSHGRAPSLSSGNEPDQVHRLSRSPIQKDLAAPPLPTVVTKGVVSPPRRARLTHLELHRRVFGADSNPRFSGDQLAPPLPRRRKTHDELRRTVFSDLSPKNSQELGDFVAELPPHANAPSSTHVRHSSTSGMSQGSFTDMSHKRSQQSMDFFPGMRRTSSPTPIGQRSRSGTVSSNTSADLSSEVLQELCDVVAEPPPPIPASPAHVRQRSRSGTVSSRASQLSGPPFVPTSPPTNIGRSRRPSVSTTLNTPSRETSPSSSILRPSPYSPSSTGSPLTPRASPSASESPSPSGGTNDPSQFRSVNNSVRLVGTAQDGLNVGDLDRPKPMSKVHERGANRQSIVLERAKMFTVSGTVASDGLRADSLLPAGRTVSKLDRSKFSFV